MNRLLVDPYGEDVDWGTAIRTSWTTCGTLAGGVAGFLGGGGTGLLAGPGAPVAVPTGAVLGTEIGAVAGGAAGYKIGDFLANSLGYPRGGSGRANPQEHHKVPHENKKWDHQNHPLVRQAKVESKNDPRNKMDLLNHGGRHTDEYQRTVRRLLDNAYTKVPGKGPDAARRALDKVFDEIEKQIACGKLKPYESKGVFVP